MQVTAGTRTKHVIMMVVHQKRSISGSPKRKSLRTLLLRKLANQVYEHFMMKFENESTVEVFIDFPISDSGLKIDLKHSKQC